MKIFVVVDGLVGFCTRPRWARPGDTELDVAYDDSREVEGRR